MRANVTPIGQQRGQGGQPGMTAAAMDLADALAAPIDDPLLTPGDIARGLAVSRSMAYALIKRRALRAVFVGRLPRVRRSEFERYLASLPGAAVR